MPRRRRDQVNRDALRTVEQTCERCGQVFQLKRSRRQQAQRSDRYCYTCLLERARELYGQ